MTRPASRGTLLAAALLLLGAAAAPALTIKLGSLAPANSPWDIVLQRLAADWARISDGTVELKIFPGGIAGDEDDIDPEDAHRPARRRGR